MAELRRLAAIPEEDLLADPDKVSSAKYNFVAAIEACIDAANHVIAAEYLQRPADGLDLSAREVSRWRRTNRPSSRGCNGYASRCEAYP